MTGLKSFLGSCAALCVLAGCGKDDDEKADQASSDTASCPVVVADADCDKSQRPFVFVHGTYGSGDNFAHVAALLGSNGFCQDRIVTIEYNSLGDQPGTNGQLDQAIDKILAETGAIEVDLAGHSQGTRHCGAYLADPAHAAKVAHYINFSGRVAVPNDVETLSLSSEKDLGNMPNHATGSHVTTFTMKNEDHFAVAASSTAFVELYKYLRGEPPKYTEIQCGEDPVIVSGIAETFADNVPLAGRLEISEVGDTPGVPKGNVITVQGAADGVFGPIELKRNVPYEFKGFDVDGTLIGYQYFTPFKRSNRLVRLLSPSKNTVVAQLSTDHIVRGPNHVAITARWAGGAFRQDLGDSLKFDGAEVLTGDNAGAAALAGPNAGGVVGMFFYDVNSDGMSDMNVDFTAPFIDGTDLFLDASSLRFMEVGFDAHDDTADTKRSKVKIPTWPSSDALLLVMFQ